MNKTMSDYQPGVCNIGTAEIERRRRFGLAGTLIALALTLIMGALGVSDIFKILIFFPAVMGAIGLLQAYTKFCAAYGLSAVFNFDDKEFKTKPILEQQAIAADKRMAWDIIAKSMGIAIIFTFLAIVLT